MSYCPTCGTAMKPLATSEYCPNDCDRIPTKIEDAPTLPVRTRVQKPCCSKPAPDKFMLAGIPRNHCWNCGAVW